MESLSSIITESAPAIIAAGGLLWSFSKQITHIEANLQALEHQIDDCKKAIEGNRQGRLEIFGVLNNSLKPKDNELSERLARVEEQVRQGITPSEVYTRLAKLESELQCKDK